MDMVERVARALCVAADMDPDRPSNDERDNGAPLWTTYVGMARAGIEAMREPTEGMAAAGAKYHKDNWRKDHALEDTPMRYIWFEMIDAALSPSVPLQDKEK